MVKSVASPLGLDASRVIDRDIYVDPDVFEAEKSRIFHKTWQWLGHVGEMRKSGDYLTADIAGVPVVVARDRDGELHGFFNSCTHRGAILAPKRRGNCGAGFQCMYHAWNFDMEGKCVGIPWPEAYGEIDRTDYDVPPLRVEVFADLVFVTLDDSLPSLLEYLGTVAPYVEEIAAGTEPLGRVRWWFEGNWELWHENFRDMYHPQFTHRSILAGYKSVETQGENFWLDDGHGLLSWPLQRNAENVVKAMEEATGLEFTESAESAGLQARQRPPADVGDRTKWNHISAVFPNLDFQFGGGGAGRTLQVVRPVSPGRTIVELMEFGVRGESAEARQWRLEHSVDTQSASGKISGDDNEATRRVQIGVGARDRVPWSNFSRGQSPGKKGEKHDEYSIRSFYDAWRRRMGPDFSW